MIGESTGSMLRGEVWESIAGQRGGDGKWLAMWAARRYGGLKLREIGAAFGGADYAAVSIGLKRFEQRASRDRALKRQQGQLVRMLNVEA